MRFEAKTVLILLALAIPLWTAAWASVGATLSIAPAGDGLFLLSGQGIERAAALDVTIGYATATPAKPQVTKAALLSGALMALNDQSSGSLRLGIIKPSPLGGSGRIASIRFADGNAAAKVLSLNASLFGAEGEPIRVLTRVINPVAATPSPSSPPVDEEPVAGEGGGTADPAEETPVADGPADGQRELMRLRTIVVPNNEENRRAPATETEPILPLIEIPESLREATVKARQPEPLSPRVADSVQVPFPAILERFRLFRQEKTPGNLLALFASVENGSDIIYQEPAIALADGKERVKIILELPQAGESLRSFALIGARLVSSRRQGEKTWVVEVRPQALTHETSLCFLYNGIIIRFNLTVAPDFNPDLDGSGVVSETDFTLFLQQRGTEQSPRFDLNGDGLRDYIDDYIYTANYLLKRQSGQI